MLQTDAAGGFHPWPGPWRRSGTPDRPGDRHVHAEPLDFGPRFAFLGHAKNLISGLNCMELLGCLLVAPAAIRMMLLGQAAIARLDRLEIRIRFKLEHSQRPHLVAAPAAVAGPCPGIMGTLPVG